MAIDDFGFGGSSSVDDNTPPVKADETIVSIDGDEVQYDENGNPVQPIDNAGDGDKNKDTTEPEGDSTLEAGTELQIGDDVYKVDDKGNVVDANGNIYKEAKDVKEWLDSFDKDESNDDNDVNIGTIQKALGITITDENDVEIEYDNTPEGVKAYVEQVIENSRQENYQTAIDTLFDKYPFAKDIIDYYEANGQSLEGFGQTPDRSNITLEESNEDQQEYIIKTAWKEQNRKGDVNGYIQYLKSTGNLFNVAQEELEGLIEADKAAREKVAQQAEQAKQERLEASKAYWNNIHDIVNSRVIAGYNIPESIVINRDGKKMTATVKDFFNYIYQVDGEGKTRYTRDLEAEDPQARINDDILRAYLKFTGGSYSNLVDMAINKKEVNKLILKSKETKKPSMSIKKPTVTKTKNVDLGYK